MRELSYLDTARDEGNVIILKRASVPVVTIDESRAMSMLISRWWSAHLAISTSLLQILPLASTDD